MQTWRDGDTTDKERMPTFMFKTRAGTGYLFRRAVPKDVRQIIGKREFKIKLCGDYKAACRECERLASETSAQIDAARRGFQQLRRNPFHVWDQLEVIREVTPSLAQQFYSTVLATIDMADIQRREATVVGDDPGFDLSEALEAMRASEGALRRALSEGDCSAFRSVTHQTLHFSGYKLADELIGTISEGKLLLAFVRAQLAGIQIVLTRYDGNDPAVLIPAAPLKKMVGSQQEKSSMAQVMLLSVVIGEFLAHLPPSQRAMNKKHSFILPAFLEVVGDMPISELRQSHIKDFLLIVQKLPPRWPEIRRKKNNSIRGLAESNSGEALSLKTYDGTYRASLRTFLERGVSDWQDIGFPTTLTTKVLYLGSRTKTENKQRALRLEEIELIFFHERMKKILIDPKQVHKFWLLAIGLYTGARVREICQINPQSDFGCKEGNWWLRLTDENGDMPDADVIKSMKTNRPRTIPVHSELIRIGLIDYLSQLRDCGARRIFPAWAPKQGDAGASPGKFVIAHLQAIGLHGIENEIGNSVRGSHTFRHTLLTVGRKNGVNLRPISGHKESTDNEVADGYEDETMLITLEDMVERLSKLDYGIMLPIPVKALVRVQR